MAELLVQPDEELALEEAPIVEEPIADPLLAEGPTRTSSPRDIPEALTTHHVPEETLASILDSSEGPSLGETLGAAFRLENIALTAINAITDLDNTPLDPNHNPLDIIKDTIYEQHFLDNFLGSWNEEDTRATMARIDEEIQDREILNASGTLGMVAGLAAGIIDLPTLIPGGAVVQTGRVGLAAGRSAVRIGALAAGAAAGAEIVLQATQETRPAEESALNIATSAILGGMLGGAVGAISARQMRQLEFQLADDLVAPLNPADDIYLPGGLGTVNSAGAAAVRTGDNAVKSAGGAEKILAFPDPVLRLQTGPSIAARRTVEDLAETPLVLDKNARGEPTAPGGSVETRITMIARAAKARATDAQDAAYNKYRFGKERVFMGRARGEMTAQLGQSGGKMSHTEFRKQISRAMRRKDQHKQPEVAEAARAYRKEYDQFKNDAIEQGLLPEGITVDTADSYLNRVYNREAIAAKRGVFKGKIASWLTDQEKTNSGVRVKLKELLDEHSTLRTRIRKLEKQISGRTATADKTAARREEVSRLNKFAFQRSERLSEPLDETRGQIDVITTEIQDTLDQIDELTDLIRTERADLPELVDVERQLQSVSRGLSDMRARADLIDAVEAGDEIEEGLTGLIDSFQTAMVRFRGEAKAIRGTPEAEALAALEKQRGVLGKTIRPFRKELARLRKELQALEKRRLPIARGGAPFETEIRARGNALADQESGRRAAVDALQLDLESRQARLEEVTADIEARTLDYQGNTGKPAKSAVASRSKAAEGRAADQPRLRSADKPVLRSARRIAKQFDKDELDLDDLSERIIDRILSTPDGRLSYDAPSATGEFIVRTVQGNAFDLRGPMRNRVFNIPDEMIEDFLEDDAEMLFNIYARTMAPDIELTRKFGDVNMETQIKEVREEFNAKIAQTTDEAESTKLHKQADAAIRDLAGIRDRLRGTYALPTNPDGMMSRTARAVKTLNYARLLGGMTLSAIPDLSRAVMVHGLTRTYRDGFVPLVRSLKTFRLSANEVKAAGQGLDMMDDNRAMSIADILDNHGKHSKFERGLNSMNRTFGIVSLMAPWNAAVKQFAGVVTMSRILQNAEIAAKTGKLAPKELEAMAAGGIDIPMAQRIWGEFESRGGKIENGAYLPNTEGWLDRGAIESFRGAMSRDINRIIVTPGQERPLFISTELGSMLLQFKSFSLASTQRTLLSGLQQRDMAALNGMIMAMGLGAMTYAIKETLAGREVSDDPAIIAANAFDRSGLAGWFMEANNITEKLTRGRVGISAITGQQISRYASRDIWGALLGPTASGIEDAFQFSGAAFAGDMNEHDARAGGRLIPYRNVFYARNLFDAAGGEINSLLVNK